MIVFAVKIRACDEGGVIVHFLVLSVMITVLACPPGDPGTVVVVGGGLEPIEFSIEAGIDYQLSYNTSRLALWFDEGQTEPAPPDTTFQSPPPQIDHGDMNGDTKVNGADVQLFVEVFLGIETDPDLIDQADFDENGSVDMADVPRFVAALPGQQRTGDMNRDGRVDGNDIQLFVNMLLGAVLVPGDLDEDGDVDPSDLAMFINVLLGIETDPDLVDLADLNGDGLSDGADIQAFVQAFLDPAAAPDPNEADLDFSGVADLADVLLFIEVLLFGVTTPSSTITLFAEGLAPSGDLCDTPIDLLTDPEGDGTFAWAATEETTVVELSLRPTPGGIGTEVSATITPAIPPLAFDAVTTAEWEGQYQPLAGPPTSSFAVSYSAEQVRELSSAEAAIVVGDGTLTNVPDPTDLDGGGTLVGEITIQFSDIPIRGAFDFALDTDAAVWEMVTYPYDGMDPPTIDGEPDNLQQLLLSELPDPENPSEELLLAANDFHFAAVVRIDENSSTVADAPATILVDLVSFDSNEVEIDRLEDVVLQRLDPDDDPEHLVYHNDLTVPIVLVDTALNKDNYPNVLLLRALTDGSAGIVPSLD